MKLEDLLSLPIEEKIGQLFVIGISGVAIEHDTAELLDEIRPGGVCLFSRNIREAAQTRELLDGLRLRLKIEPVLCIDQEGGLVDRLRRIMTPMPAASSITDEADAALLGSIAAETLRILGFNLNFAPVIDVVSVERAKAVNGLFSRTFGTSETEAATFAKAFLMSMRDEGCIGCLKHFPGLGASAVDSHEELPVVDLTYSELWEADLLPYRELLADSAAVMVAHAAYPKIDLQETDQNGKLLPSSLSYNFVTKLLRTELKFKGLTLTDDLEMGAILKNYGIAEACRLAVEAGNDMLAICADAGRIREGYYGIIDAVQKQKIPESRIDESLVRIAELKSSFEPALPFDESRLAALSTEIQKLKDRSN